ncbi:acyl-CoA thioesterase [Thermodesulforhabdus norvegica]|uniref:Acyl-CoA thioester hydrolase n=1 Tax=Thermodesulforhabdus norvegica TaxID=39841 RepID=A0A1I4RB62_9BACT|nr:thioesterase family protein [Thermodesulforhabdus norvegica]SFM49538.1 acyl-CoA thioester hydrolase [Thermodesulforhabdus norvegica]
MNPFGDPEKPQGSFIAVPVSIHFGDTDPYGVVYFASYFRYCHQGIEALFERLGLPPHLYFRNSERGFGLPIVGASCDFYRPVKYGDKLTLKVCVKHLKAKSVTFGFFFYKENSEDLVAKGEATIVAIDRNWKSCALPDDVRSALEKFAGDLN